MIDKEMFFGKLFLTSQKKVTSLQEGDTMYIEECEGFVLLNIFRSQREKMLWGGDNRSDDKMIILSSLIEAVLEIDNLISVRGWELKRLSKNTEGGHARFKMIRKKKKVLIFVLSGESVQYCSHSIIFEALKEIAGGYNINSSRVDIGLFCLEIGDDKQVRNLASSERIIEDNSNADFIYFGSGLRKTGVYLKWKYPDKNIVHQEKKTISFVKK